MKNLMLEILDLAGICFAMCLASMLVLGASAFITWNIDILDFSGPACRAGIVIGIARYIVVLGRRML